ncbi:MAG: ImmA/IrrE family metallo-endopeptidase [FCB group bacterium]|nr:ImmA/IrrE family metallo-endopeptidase [FCB group bacterium]
MDKSIVSENLRRLRKHRKLSQTAVAEGAGISLSTYRNIEKELSTPRVDTLMSIADILEIDLKQILAPVNKLSAVRFRAKKQMNSRSQILADVGSWLRDFNQLEEILANKVEFKLERFISSLPPTTEMIAAAIECRSFLGLKPDEPIQDICGLLESVGVKVYTYNLASHDFFGLSVAANDGGPAIVINTFDRIPVERWIFSAAHELAHLLFHLDSFDVEQSDENQVQEKEADVFASHFLMPQDAFQKKWQESAGLNSMDRVLKVKRYFKVSYKTVLYRLNELFVREQNIYQWFNTEYKQRTGKSLADHREPDSQHPKVFSASMAESLRSKEPENLSNIEFIESRLDRLVRLAIEKEEISLGRGAEILERSLEEMRELANSWNAYA